MPPESIDPEHFRALLQQLAVSIDEIGDAAAEGAGTVELDQTRVGRLSRMDALQAQVMSVETRRRQQETLAGIRRALAKLDEDEYGYCETCGEEIQAGRLEADPIARWCIRCASRRESG